MNKTVNLFVLAGCWECPDDIGVTVVAISSDEKQLIDRLDQIADTQAKEYVSIEGRGSIRSTEWYFLMR